MKNMENMKKVEINHEKNCLTVAVELPFGLTPKAEKFKPIDPIDVIKAFAPILKSAIDERIRDCWRGLTNNLDNIAEVTPEGRVNYINGHFSLPTFNMMGDMIKALDQRDYRPFIEKRAYADQALKALLLGHVLRVDQDGIKFETLIGILCEVHMFGD